MRKLTLLLPVLAIFAVAVVLLGELGDTGAITTPSETSIAVAAGNSDDIADPTANGWRETANRPVRASPPASRKDITQYPPTSSPPRIPPTKK